MAAPHTPHSLQGASRHEGPPPSGASRHDSDLSRKWEGQVKGGSNVQPHTVRKEGWQRRKIARMQKEAQTTPKIG
jgi:hypothetical protein